MRVKAGITQEDLAQAFGVQQPAISDMENDVATINPSRAAHLRQICAERKAAS